jgi:hypothetical protein
MSFCPRAHMDRQMRGRMALKRANKFATLAEKDAKLAREATDPDEAASKAFSARLYYERVKEARDESLRLLG